MPERTHLQDIFQDMYVGLKHELEKANYEKAATQFVAIIRCQYDKKLYRLTIEQVEQKNES